MVFQLEKSMETRVEQDNKLRKYLPEKLYQLKYELLEPGDILAMTVPESFTSGAIRFFTGGAFSHVALCCMKGALIEAVEGGVFLTIPNRLFVKNIDNIRIYRLKPDLISSTELQEFSDKLTSKCLEMYLSNYSTIKAMCVPLSKINFKGANEGYFCSELVSAAYLNSGIALCPDLPPEKTSPKNVYDSDKLVEMDNKEYFKEVKRNEIVHLYDDSEIKVSDSSEKKQVSSLHESFELASQMLKNKKEMADDFDFTISKQLLANKMTEYKLSIYADKGKREKEIEDIVEKGLGNEKITVYQEAIKSGEESMEVVRKVIEGYWKIDEFQDKTENQISVYLCALQRSIGLMYINYMIVHENIGYVKRLLMEKDKGNGNS